MSFKNFESFNSDKNLHICIKNTFKLFSMVHTQEKVHVMRDGGQIQEVSSDMIVPGDIILIPPRGCVLHCDAVLMTGTVRFTV